MSSFNYAAAFGFHSVAASVIFAVLFLAMGLWFVRQSIKNTTFVYIVLTLFCAMRFAAYIIRAILAHSTSAGSNLSLFIADEVLFGVGFFALLYSAYTLVLDRDILAGGKGPGSLFSPNLFNNPHLFRMVLSGTVALSILQSGDISTGKTLRKASIAIFFALTVVQAAQTIWYFKDQEYSKSSVRPFGDRNGRYLLCLISLLMLVREQNQESLWYPLVALPELLAVGCYSVSGLVPTRAALKAAKHAGS
ncbi:hypothetical protein B0H13DRAFT_2107669 [Mycena leptocephala]|nr:hypothetical protein B0H13DRAFT_2107669 [Mycena leptocephala]